MPNNARPANDREFWDAMVKRILEDLGALKMPCTRDEMFAHLRMERWPAHMISNTLAYADGKNLFLRNGRWYTLEMMVVRSHRP